MMGAIIGDVVGSKYEFRNIKTKEFSLLSNGCTFTDDSVMTIAVARAILTAMEQKTDFSKELVKEMQSMGQKYPYAGYGGMFSSWIKSEDPKPYNSFGNGSAMRVSPCGIMAVELEEALSLAKVSAEVTHNHPEGIKGAQAVAGAIFLAKTKKSKDEIKAFIEDSYYQLDFTLDNIRDKYRFDVTCQGSVPQAIVAFLESENFEDAIRNAISIGGDSDTIAAIAGSIAWAFYVEEGICTPMNHPSCLESVRQMLPDEFNKTIDKFWAESVSRFDSYQRLGFCSGIPHKA